MASCEKCSTPFERKRPWQRFCGVRCQMSARVAGGHTAAAQRRHRANMTPEKRAEYLSKHAERQRAVNATEEGKRLKRDVALRASYGLTLEQVEAMITAQNGVCPICLQTITALGETKRRRNVGCAVDHDHNTGKVRGILCQPCNASLGGFGDDMTTLKRAFDYLKHNSGG